MHEARIQQWMLPVTVHPYEIVKSVEWARESPKWLDEVNMYSNKDSLYQCWYCRCKTTESKWMKNALWSESVAVHSAVLIIGWYSTTKIFLKTANATDWRPFIYNFLANGQKDKWSNLKVFLLWFYSFTLLHLFWFVLKDVNLS